MTMKIKSLVVAAVLSSVSALAWAEDASIQLRSFVKNVQAATGEFTQQVFGAQGEPQAAQQGEFAFHRQGQFRWEVLQPYEQLVLSDGQFVYQYDPDLMQVTQRGVDEAIGTSPAAILFGSRRIDDAFNLTDLPDRDGMQWLRAQPRTSDAGFEYVDIGFQNNLPTKLELRDTFGQTTRISLRALQPQETIAAERFHFVVPEGVDLVRMP